MPVLARHVAQTHEFLVPMADDAAAAVVAEMLKANASYSTLEGATRVLNSMKSPPSEPVDELRRGLRIELSFTPLRRAEACLDRGGCPSRAAYLLRAITHWDRAAERAKPELMAAWHHPDRHVSLAARRALAAAGAREVLPELMRDIRAGELPSYRQDLQMGAARAAGDLGLLGEKARDAVPEIRRVLLRNENKVHRRLWLETLGALGGEEAVSELRAELRRPHGDTGSAATALGTLGKQANRALPQLKLLALNHALHRVRRAAARAASLISGVVVKPKQLSCARNVEGRVHVRSRVIEIRAIGGQHAVGPRGRIHDERRGRASYRHGQLCFVSRSRGEFGGWVEVHNLRTGTAYSAGRDVHVLRFLVVSGNILAIDGLLHMSASGQVLRLVRRRDGYWVLEPLTDQIGFPVGYSRNKEGNLLLLAHNGRLGEILSDCRLQVLRVRSDGWLEAVE